MPADGARVSTHVRPRGTSQLTGSVVHVGAYMVAIVPDDPALAADLDEFGRVWRYGHEVTDLDAAPPVGETFGETFEARYPGNCAGCGHQILTFDPIRRSSYRRTFHERCAR